MKARFLRESTLETLRRSVKKNLDVYRKGKFSELPVDTSNWFEIDHDIDADCLEELKDPVGQDNFEVKNCIIMYKALDGLTPYKARDERLWAYLTHTLLLNHSRKRWPIPDDNEEAVSHIQKHFFAKDKRQIERDNAASRLWWMAHLCNRIHSMKIEDSLRAFLHMSDVRANIVERPTTSQSIPVFEALIRKLSQSLKGKEILFERNVFRQLMVEINSAGGSRLLDCMDAAQIEKILDGIIRDRLALKAV